MLRHAARAGSFDRFNRLPYNGGPMSGLSYESSGVNYDVLDAFKRACQREAATTRHEQCLRGRASRLGSFVLEPDEHPAARPFKQALVADGIPFTSFAVDDVHAEFERLRGLGVQFTQEPAEMGPVTTAVLDDTCGNLIQIAHQDG
jgi:hypothetical protein